MKDTVEVLDAIERVKELKRNDEVSKCIINILNGLNIVKDLSEIWDIGYCGISPGMHCMHLDLIIRGIKFEVDVWGRNEIIICASKDYDKDIETVISQKYFFSIKNVVRYLNMCTSYGIEFDVSEWG